MATSKSTSLLIAVTLAFATAACGPNGKSIPKAMMGAVTGGEHASESSSFFSSESHSLVDTDSTADVVGEETLFFSSVSSRGAPSAFSQEMAQEDNASIPADGRVEITREDLASLRVRGGRYSREVHGFLPDGADRLSVRVLVALNRAAAAIPSEEYLPQAVVTVARGSGDTQTLTISFENGDELDPGAEFPESILSDARKIVILRMPSF